VILAANGAETPRLLLLSTSPQFPDGLANSSGLVGKYMMWNAHADTFAQFEHPLNEYKSVQVTRIVHDFYDSDPARGFYGGGGLDGRLWPGPLMFSLFATAAGRAAMGRAFRDALREMYTRTMCRRRGRHVAAARDEQHHAGSGRAGPAGAGPHCASRTATIPTT
jgi:choline dehydrogenase-like flavoprotein